MESGCNFDVTTPSPPSAAFPKGGDSGIQSPRHSDLLRNKGLDRVVDQGLS